VHIYFLALNRTDSITHGFLPAAQRLGARVTLLTDQPDQYEPPSHIAGRTGPKQIRSEPLRADVACADVACAEQARPEQARPERARPEQARPERVVRCDVRNVSAVVGCVAELGRPDAIFTNSDHLQVQAALAATYLGLPAKDWTAALRTKNKALMRRHLAAAGLDTVAMVDISPDDDPAALAAVLPYPCVVKPREGVASEDVVLVEDAGELVRRVTEIRRRRPDDPLVAEEYLDGPLHTLETLGDRDGIQVLGSFRTRLSPPPYFVEHGLDWDPDLPDAVRDDVLRQLAALGVGLGACHTEFVRQGDRARLVEVNYRIIGDQCDLLLAELLDEPLFELVLRAHLGDGVAVRTSSPDGARRRHGRVDYVCAQASGTLRTAPEAQDLNGGPVRLAYRPLRPVGSRIRLTNSNRDYLGVLRAVGDDQPVVDQAVDHFRSAHRWEVRP